MDFDLEFMLLGKQGKVTMRTAVPKGASTLLLYATAGNTLFHRKDCSAIRDSGNLEATAHFRLPTNYSRCARCSPPLQTTPYREAGPVVFVYTSADRGTKYHRKNCGQLYSQIRYDIRDLPAGYTPCGHCHPPERPKTE